MYTGGQPEYFRQKLSRRRRCTSSSPKPARPSSCFSNQAAEALVPHGRPCAGAGGCEQGGPCCNFEEIIEKIEEVKSRVHKWTEKIRNIKLRGEPMRRLFCHPVSSP